MFAARAPDGRRAEVAAADVSELTGLFERAAAHERVNGYSNVAGRQFPNFGAFLLHALERVGAAGCATGVHATSWSQACKEATRYATLRVPERSVLVVRCTLSGSSSACVDAAPRAGAVRAAVWGRARHARAV
jgi:hypothetical protein